MGLFETPMEVKAIRFADQLPKAHRALKRITSACNKYWKQHAKGRGLDNLKAPFVSAKSVDSKQVENFNWMCVQILSKEFEQKYRLLDCLNRGQSIKEICDDVGTDFQELMDIVEHVAFKYTKASPGS